MELKYCEGCGGLLLRRSGDRVVYCAACQYKLSELPTADGPHTPPATASVRSAPAAHRVEHSVTLPDAGQTPKYPPQPAVPATNRAEPRRRA